MLILNNNKVQIQWPQLQQHHSEDGYFYFITLSNFTT
uniref:Uncharacterized protein n=1 Tax=Arundo donax TaxID=35708 RepID=A0A0A9BPD8_ARUDO